MSVLLVIPRTNTFRFKKLGTNLNSLDAALFADAQFQLVKFSKPIYYQKFNVGDDILIQYITNLSTSIKLYDSQNALISTITPDLIHTYSDNSGNKIYNTHINTSTLFGKYSIKIEANEVSYQSEWIDIGNYSDLPLIQYYGNRFDGIFYTIDTIFGFRLEAHIGIYTPTIERESYEGYNYQPIIVKAIPKRCITFKIKPIPFFLVEKLNIACTKENIIINGTRYVSTEGGKTKIIDEKVNWYSFESILQEKDYENYFNIADLSQPAEPTEAVFIRSYDGVNFRVYDTENSLRKI